MSTSKDRIALQRQRELRRHENTIEEAQKSFVELGRALGKIRAEQLYAVAGCQTFEEYVEERWDIGRAHAYRLISAARVALSLSPMGYKIDSERVARELAAAPDDEARARLAEEATRRADGRRLTAALVAATREEMFPDAVVIDGDVVDDEQPALEPAPADLTDALTQAIEETAAHTSAAGPAATTGGAFPPVGEPVDVGVAAASTGTQTAADGADTTEADAGPARPVAPTEAATAPESVGDQEQERDEEEVACFECSAPLDPRDAADGYYKCLDCDPERLFRAAPDSPAADPLAPPSPQQPGQDSPTGREGGRSETIHQQVAGVSPAGVAPGSGSGPQHADPVEPVELEDGGDASLPPSSSDPVLMAFAALLILIRQVDVEALGPRLFDEEMALLDQHVDDIALFVAKLGKARFAEMLHTQ